jgi:hypothetical protein
MTARTTELGRLLAVALGTADNLNSALVRTPNAVRDTPDLGVALAV